MALQIARVLENDQVRWCLHHGAEAPGQLTTIDGDWMTTGEFLTQGGPAAAERALELKKDAPSLTRADARLLSPVTPDGDFICQGLNYASHLRELGMDPSKATENILFHKASSSLCGALDDVVRPSRVRALDYELELGLVVGAEVTGPVEVTSENLHQFVAGLVMVNDISARDVQLAAEQFCKGKSYRTFGPTGPFLVLPTRKEWSRWGELILTLSVNGELRQQAPASDMIHQPADTIRELSEVRDLRPGDLIATGTPAGVALQSPGKVKALIARLLSPGRRAQIVTRLAEHDPRYLKPGDEIVATIATADGAIDLGEQRNRVVDAARAPGAT